MVRYRTFQLRAAPSGRGPPSGRVGSPGARWRCRGRRCPASRATRLSLPPMLAKSAKILCKIFANFANFWRARSRLYQNEILQENTRSTTLFKLYKICVRLHRCSLKILANNRFEKSAIFVKIQQSFDKCCKICKMLRNFKKFS